MSRRAGFVVGGRRDSVADWVVCEVFVEARDGLAAEHAARGDHLVAPVVAVFSEDLGFNNIVHYRFLSAWMASAWPGLSKCRPCRICCMLFSKHLSRRDISTFLPCNSIIDSLLKTAIRYKIYIISSKKGNGDMAIKTIRHVIRALASRSTCEGLLFGISLLMSPCFVRHP